MLSIMFHSKPVVIKIHKTKIRTFNFAVNTIFWNDEIPKENIQLDSSNKYWFRHDHG